MYIVRFKVYFIGESVVLGEIFGGWDEIDRGWQLKHQNLVYSLSCPALGIIFPGKDTDHRKLYGGVCRLQIGDSVQDGIGNFCGLFVVAGP